MSTIRDSRVYRRLPDRQKRVFRLDWGALILLYAPILLYKQLRAVLMFSVVWPFIRQGTLTDLTIFEQRVYSQNGEDGILKVIFKKIGTTDKFCIEFGVGDGTECNTRYLREKEGWRALLMDTNERAPPFVKKEFITPDNVNSLFIKYGVPKEFDLLSLDLDYNTYWVWKGIEGFHPRVVVIEYNSTIPPGQRKVVQYNPRGLWDGTDYLGASLSALDDLGRAKGYSLLACDSTGVNAFFVRADLVRQHFRVGSIRELYRPPWRFYRLKHSTKKWLVLTGQSNGNILV